MQIDGTSGSYTGGGLAALLSMLQSQAVGQTGQFAPSGSSGSTTGAASTSATTAASPTASTASSQFSTETLAALLQAQQPQTDPATAIANQMITDLGGGSSGSVSLSQVESAVTGSSGASAANTTVSTEFSKLDTNGDGQLTASELASGLKAMGPPPDAPPPPTGSTTSSSADAATTIANQLISDLGGGASGSVSLAQVESALTGSSSSSSANTTVATEFSKLDTNGDGQLSSSELATGLQAMLQAGGGRHHHHHPFDASSSDTSTASTSATSATTTTTAAATTDATATTTTTGATTTS